MLTLNPYDTTYGSILNISKLKEDITKYLIGKDIDKLCYEFIHADDVKIVFITGCNEEERNLTPFDHPIVMEDIRHKKLIVSDVRKYVNINKREDTVPVSIDSITRDKNGLEFVVIRTLITVDYMEGRVGRYRVVSDSVAGALAMWLGTAINTVLGLDNIELMKVKMLIAYYAHHNMVNDGNNVDMDDSITGGILKSKLTTGIPMKESKQTLELMNPEIKGLQNLLEVLKLVVPESKREFLTANNLLNTIMNSWFGHGGSETVMISLEHMPTFMALVYVSAENRSYKRFPIATILDKFKSTLKLDNYIKHVSQELDLRF